jgi:hypothetical protein
MDIQTFFAIREQQMARDLQDAIRRRRFRDACSSIETSECRADYEHRVLLGHESNETTIKFRNHPLKFTS